MNRIETTFANLKKKGEKAFISYVCAGDPSFDISLEVIKGLANSGADIIELGVPFSDPLADGIVNQMAASRALEAGMSTPRVLDLVREFRKTHDTPIVLFTYLNPIFAYGYQQFIKDAQSAGVDGVLILDLPPEEAAQNQDLTIDSGLCHITLIAPTTPEDRVKLLAESSSGFIYALSRTGVTGANVEPSKAIGSTISKIQSYTNVPVCVGFGISTADHAREQAQHADGVIVGSAIVKQIEKNPNNAVNAVLEFAKPLIAAVK